MKKNPSIYLNHILSSIEKIEEYSFEKTLEMFLADTLIQDGIIRKIEVIGEAMNHLEENIINNYPDIFWQEIIATRNILIHEYWDVDLLSIWHDVTVEIPKLKNQIQDIIKSFDNNLIEK